MKRIVFILFISLGIVACSSNTGQKVERGTGKLLEGTGNLVDASVNSAKHSWQVATPEELNSIEEPESDTVRKQTKVESGAEKVFSGGNNLIRDGGIELGASWKTKKEAEAAD